MPATTKQIAAALTKATKTKSLVDIAITKEAFVKALMKQDKKNIDKSEAEAIFEYIDDQDGKDDGRFTPGIIKGDVIVVADTKAYLAKKYDEVANTAALKFAVYNTPTKTNPWAPSDDGVITADEFKRYLDKAVDPNSKP